MAAMTAATRRSSSMSSLYISSAYSSGSAPHQREESEVANMRRLCHFRIRLRGWDCTRGYDLFFCVCTCVGLHLVRVHSQLEKKEFRLHPGKEDTRSSRTQTVLEMFETRIFISSLY